jgi:hypothetical protein
MNNASPIEIVYTIGMVLTFFTSLWNLAYALARRREMIREKRNGLLLIYRTGVCWDQFKLTLAHVGLIVIGIVSLATPSNPQAPTGAQWTTGVAFLAVSGVLAWLSIGVRRRPGRMRPYLETVK